MVLQGQWKALIGTDVVEQVRRQLADDKIRIDVGKPLSARDGTRRADVSDPNELVYKTGDDVPVYWVSWEEAVEFCHRLTERERTERWPVGQGEGCRAGVHPRLTGLLVVDVRAPSRGRPLPSARAAPCRSRASSSSIRSRSW